jgi:hypothetical protein
VVRNASVGSVSTKVRGGALNLALGTAAQANSGTVAVNSGSIGNAHVYSGAGIVVNDVESPVDFGQNINIATGGHVSNKNSVIIGP